MNKKIKMAISTMLCSVIFISGLGYNNIKAESKDNSTGCPIKIIDNSGTNDGQDFIQMISEAENIDLDDKNVKIEYYTDGSMSITRELDNGDFEVFTPLTEEQANEIYETNKNKPATRVVGGVLIWQGLVELFNFVRSAGRIIHFGCNVIRLTGVGDPCSYISDAILSSIGSAPTARFELTQYMYKDPSCPYPPNSLQCSQPPYAYLKTTFRRVS